MNPTWAARLRRADARLAASLRLRANVEACESGDDLWLRGAGMTEDLDVELRKIAPEQRYDVLPDGQLKPDGLRIPEGKLPRADWRPLIEYITPEAPPAASPGVVERLSLKLVRSETEKPATLLVTTFHAFADYAETAPSLRLDPLRFAADGGRALLRGTPLPPLPGTRYVEEHGVAVPAGWSFSPSVGTAVIRALLELDGDDVALFATDGSFERIRAAQFVPARRSAVRLTAKSSGRSNRP